MIIYDNKFSEVKQVDSKPFTVNALQMQQINENVFNYFGTSAGILQNKYTEDEWNAYYEGKIEPFALQLSLVMSNMTFSNAKYHMEMKLHLRQTVYNMRVIKQSSIYQRSFLTEAC